MNIVLICPRCKTRVTVDYDNWCKSLLPAGNKYICPNPLCPDKELIYHKDENEREGGGSRK